MPELRDENLGEQKQLPKKISWDELRRIKKLKEWRRATRRYQFRHKSRVKKQRERRELKKKLKKQEEHPETILAKRKFWIINP